jgi:hypothetical protein
MDKSFLGMLTTISSQIKNGFAEMKDPIMDTVKVTKAIYKSTEGKFRHDKVACIINPS